MECVICSEQMGEACAIMPCCKNKLCSICFANCIARNVGNDEGTTRNQCIFCRKEICKKVLPDTKLIEKYLTIKENNNILATSLEKSLLKIQSNLNMIEEQQDVITRLCFIANRRQETIKKLSNQMSINNNTCIKNTDGFCCCSKGSWDDI
tara:strand:- start:817 stop:1269 length:453 start_codon:yes stop_codon:yes gene_type:complete